MKLLLEKFIIAVLGSAALCFWAPSADAKPNASQLFCDSFPESTTCSGKAISCNYCHNGFPPALGPYGKDFQENLRLQESGFPTEIKAMQEAISAIFAADSDADGHNNESELNAGTLPGNKDSVPPTLICDNDAECTYNQVYAYKKISLSICGEPADWEDMELFLNANETERSKKLDEKLDDCLDSENWLAKDGIVWRIGHYKIRPIGSVKAGEDKGLIEIVDYYADYQLFVYSQMDDNDAREQLLADYTIDRNVIGGSTQYDKIEAERLDDGQVMQPEYRVGLLTSFWNLSFYLNYTAVARVLVAQAFNAYLGLSLALMEGLNPPAVKDSKFKDYDNKGVDRFQCALCHETIDALAYPFRNYNGLSGTQQVLAGENAGGLSDIANLGDEDSLTPLSYAKPRMDYLNQRFPGINQMPEAGYIFGKKVNNLREWAEVLVNSEQFAANSTKDYWRVLVGHEPRADEQQEFKAVWKNFMTTHKYRIEKMIKDIVRTKAFGAP